MRPSSFTNFTLNTVIGLILISLDFGNLFSWNATVLVLLLLYFVFFSFGDILVFRFSGCRAGAPYLQFYAFCLLLYARQPIRLYAYIAYIAI